MALDAWLVKIDDDERIATVHDMSWSGNDLLRHGSPGTVLLRFIDPYGYTIFNRIQCAVLHDEWTAAGENLESEEARRWAAEVAGLLRRCADEYGFFVRFVGE
jgi:hypothetical protein